MKTIDFVVRTGAGAVQRGEVLADGAATPIAAGSGQQISLNLRQSDISGYQRLGSNLEITLADGRVIVLEDFFGGTGSKLFISADGYLNEVALVEGADGAVFGQYGPTEQWGKWSPSDDLIFLEGNEVAHVAAANEEEVSMLGGGLLSGLGGGIGALGVGAAVAGGGIVLGGIGGGGAGGAARIVPSIDQEGTITIAGDDTPEAEKVIVISGQAEPESEVVVTIGGKTLVTESDGEGKWSVTFEGEKFPDDGTHPVIAVVTEPSGEVTTLTGPEIMIDLTGPEIVFDDGVKSIGDLTNAVDHSDGVEIGGTGEAGASIEVTIDGITHVTTVAADGSWKVVFTPAELPGGEYETAVTVVSTDINGNSTTVTDTVVIDTVPHPITIDEATIEGDGVVNAVEESDGVTITGTSTPGAELLVEIEGLSQSVTVAADGTWSATFAAGALPGGEYDANIRVTTTDPAGNASSQTGVIRIDTVGSVAFDSNVIEGDNVINTAEMSDGFTLTGTAEAGSTVVVSYGGVSHNATVDASGNWTVDFAPGDLPAGEYDAEFTVTATDGAGNVSSDTRTIRIDTESSVTIDSGQVGGDDVVNAAEQAAGIKLTGTAEPGSSVEVSLGGVTHSATVDAHGNWTVAFAASEVPTGEQNVTVTAVATDASGNSSSTSSSLRIDTVNQVTFDAAGVEGEGVVNAVEHADGVTLTGTTQPGSTVTVQMGGVTHTATVDASGNWSANFMAHEIPTGEYDANVSVTSVDAAGNSASTTGTVEIDTFVRDFALTGMPGGSDGIVNAEEASHGMVITGQTEPGSSVVVQLGAVSHMATVAADGSWTVNFAASEIAQGEYTATVTATATDRAGNVETLTDTVEIDTVAGSLTLSRDPIEGDNIINLVEASDGVAVNGTSDPGNVVQVTLGGVTHSVVTDAAGNWTANFAAHEIAPGTYTADITATTVDRAGNSRTVTGSVDVDTEVTNLGFSPTPIEGDGVINHAERADGVSITGTVEPGSTVQVTMGGVTRAATVDASGNWQADFTAGEIPLGEYNAKITVDVVDRAGNTDSISQTVRVDTLVNALANGTAPVEGDGIVNAAEAADGVTLTGVVEAGSSIEVEFGGTRYAASVDGSGNWSAELPASALMGVDGTATVVVHATDAAGNTDTISRSFEIDTTAPDGPEIASYTRDHTGIRGISIDTTDDAVSISHVHGDGSITHVNATGIEIPVLGETTFAFAPTIPDGSHLVVSSTDAAGNMSSTYLVLDESSTSVVNMANPNLGALQIEAIDLQFAEDSQLTITEAQLTALSSNSDSVVIHGGTDDTVTITGAVRTGLTTEIEGQTHAVYTLGDTGTLIIDDDINVVI